MINNQLNHQIMDRKLRQPIDVPLRCLEMTEIVQASWSEYRNSLHQEDGLGADSTVLPAGLPAPQQPLSCSSAALSTLSATPQCAPLDLCTAGSGDCLLCAGGERETRQLLGGGLHILLQAGHVEGLRHLPVDVAALVPDMQRALITVVIIVLIKL